MVRRWGNGPVTALFLHGFGGCATSFDHLEPLLGDLLTSLCVDLPGHRGTPMPPGGFDQTVADLIGLVLGEPVEWAGGALPAPPSFIVGYSQGGRLALAVGIGLRSRRRPTPLAGLVVESASPGLGRPAARAKRRQVDEDRARLLEEVGLGPFFAQWERHPVLARLRELPVSRRRALRHIRESHTAEGLAAALRRLGQGAQASLRPHLPQLRTPTLLLSGEYDTTYTRLARAMAADLPLGWAATLREVGHAPHLECPARYAAEVRSFVVACHQASTPLTEARHDP